MAFLRARDTISGQEGRAYATIDGRVEEMFYIKTLEATVEKEKAEIKTLGKRGTQHKAIGWSGSGSMTIYYVTTLFRELMYKYMQSGVDTYFDIKVINEDPASSIGTQEIVLRNVNLNSVVMASLDTEAEALEEEIEFTFEGIDVSRSFNKPTLA